jgi:FtsZ-interacting cell division protein YlmF
MGFWDDAKSFIGFNEEGFGHHPHAQHPHQQAHPQQQQSVQAALRPAAKKVERAPIIHFPETHRKPVSNQQHQLGENVITEIVVFEPRVYEDTLSISSHLKSGRPIIVNLKNLDAINGKRLIDFVCGTAYAFDGKMQKIGPNIFLFTPPTVSILDMQERDLGQDLQKEQARGNYQSDYTHQPFMVEDPASDRYVDAGRSYQTNMFGQQKFG